MSKLTETFIDEEREISYKCAATWCFLGELKNKHVSLNEVFNSLMAGHIDPIFIKDVISCSLTHINNNEIADSQREKTAIEIIERFGLQEASLLARDMISRSMVGDIKKHQLDQNLETRALVHQIFQNSKLNPFSKVGLLWVAVAASSGLVASLILNIIMTHT